MHKQDFSLFLFAFTENEERSSVALEKQLERESLSTAWGERQQSAKTQEVVIVLTIYRHLISRHSLLSSSIYICKECVGGGGGQEFCERDLPVIWLRYFSLKEAAAFMLLQKNQYLKTTAYRANAGKVYVGHKLCVYFTSEFPI